MRPRRQQRRAKAQPRSPRADETAIPLPPGATAPVVYGSLSRSAGVGAAGAASSRKP